MAFNLKGYVEVKDRIKAFNESEEHGKKGWYFITKELDSARPKGVDLADGLNKSELGYVKMICEVYDNEHHLRATGTAQEIEDKGTVNKTSYLENCETSAIGRALGMLGYGIDKSIASKDEIDRAKNKVSKPYEIHNGITIPESEAKALVLLSIGELRQQIGATKEELGKMFAQKTMGGDAASATLKQLFTLEKVLRTANNEDSEWHSIYGTDLRKKNIVPKNQVIPFTSSKARFGKRAYELAETDEQREEILDDYSEFNIKEMLSETKR